MEKTLKSQYLNATNITTRIQLHRDFSRNAQGWSPWIYQNCGISPHMNVLELGCGNGALWTENRSQIPEQIQITLSDISEGMLRDARRDIGLKDPRFSFLCFDCHQMPLPDRSFDLVIANHLLFIVKIFLRFVKKYAVPETGRNFSVQHLRNRTHERNQQSGTGI